MAHALITDLFLAVQQFEFLTAVFWLTGDVKPALKILNAMLAENPIPQAQFADWRKDVRDKTVEFPMWYPERDDVIIPQWAIRVSTYQIIHL